MKKRMNTLNSMKNFHSGDSNRYLFHAEGLSRFAIYGAVNVWWLDAFISSVIITPITTLYHAIVYTIWRLLAFQIFRSHNFFIHIFVPYHWYIQWTINLMSKPIHSSNLKLYRILVYIKFKNRNRTILWISPFHTCHEANKISKKTELDRTEFTDRTVCSIDHLEQKQCTDV